MCERFPHSRGLRWFAAAALLALFSEGLRAEVPARIDVVTDPNPGSWAGQAVEHIGELGTWKKGEKLYDGVRTIVLQNLTIKPALHPEYGYMTWATMVLEAEVVVPADIKDGEIVVHVPKKSSRREALEAIEQRQKRYESVPVQLKVALLKSSAEKVTRVARVHFELPIINGIAGFNPSIKPRQLRVQVAPWATTGYLARLFRSKVPAPEVFDVKYDQRPASLSFVATPVSGSPSLMNLSPKVVMPGPSDTGGSCLVEMGRLPNRPE